MNAWRLYRRWVFPCSGETFKALRPAMDGANYQKERFMWKTRSLTYRVVFLAALCGSVVPARADILRFQAVEPYNSTGPVTGQRSLEVTDFDDGAGVLDSLAAILSGPGVSLLPPTPPAHLPGPDQLTSAFFLDLSAGATSGNDGIVAQNVDPGGYLRMDFSPEPSRDDLLAAFSAGEGDPAAGAGTLGVGIHVQRLADAAGRQTSDDLVLTRTIRAPVPGAGLLALFGLGAVGLSWRRFA